MRILATAPLRGPGRARLEALGEVVAEPWITGAAEPPHLLDAHDLAGRIVEVGADVVLCEADQCAGPVLDLPLRAIGSARGDPTNVDVAGATARGIPVLHAPGRNADGVAELAVGLLLAVTRGIVDADADVRAGDVFAGGTLPYQRYRAWQVAGRTVGLVGLGAVGRAVAWRLRALGMEVTSFDPFQPDATHASLDELLAGADVVSVHAALSPATAGMMGADQFAAMREGAVYLNTARGGLHDLDALVGALRRGHLGGAALDHIEGEVLPAGHPLLALPQVVLTPHIGGATYDTEAHHTALLADDLARLLAGKVPVHCANPEVLA